jgi:CRISPR-associated protein Csx16
MHDPTPYLISFLGTGNYQPVTYRFHPEGPGVETRYAALAIRKLLGPGGTTIFATAKAMETHGADIAAAFAEAGLDQPQIVPITNGATPTELQANFRTLLDTMTATSAPLVVDITHGFRSQPFFAGAALHLYRALGDSQPIQVLYGAYEAKDDHNEAPIWDLTAFVETADWSTAIATFLATGHGTALADLAESTGRAWGKAWGLSGRQGNPPQLLGLATALRSVCQALDGIRIGELLLPPAPGKTSLVTGLLEAIANARPQLEERLPVLQEPMNRLEAMLRPLSLTENHLASDAGHNALAALAQIYLDWGRLAEAAVVLREGWTCRLAPPEATCPTQPGFDEAQRRHWDAVFAEIRDIAGPVAEVRNDIQHGGMKKRPLPKDRVRPRLEAEVQRFAASGRIEPPTSTGSVWFVSRHPGAKEWAKRQGISISRMVDHLDPEQIQPGDTVIGTLPIHLAAQVCQRGARFFFLSLDLPPEARGEELSLEDMEHYGACLQEFEVRKRETIPPTDLTTPSVSATQPTEKTDPDKNRSMSD